MRPNMVDRFSQKDKNHLAAAQHVGAMYESIKAVCVVVIMAAAITAAVAWGDDRPDTTTWLFRTIPIAIALIAIAIFLSVHWKRDSAPDLLAQQAGKYFERTGFCFHFLTSAVDGKCVFLLLFQNRYERPCTARIALRPVTFGGAHNTLVHMAVQCPGAAFGAAKKEVGVPAKLQGKKVSFDVGADVEYPEGKGKMLRFKHSIVLRRNTSFVDTFARATSLLALLVGHIMIHRPVRIKCALPDNVAAELPVEIPQSSEILWKPGDPLPEAPPA
jgi:hypothetical protein